ncbi:DNA-binding protein [Niallia circulans]|uniref:DNA-binding protein n=3 Tax=Bacillaceae TaxID=186817 RepID=A0A2N0Z990_9BACI|nr:MULTISPECIES: helix-turn-helix domain-containing protein [Bacillaceae]SLL36710.1 DNA binding domain, excisionase family [Mycobacteroides abscessus subsp. abscessus]HEO8421710.1 helix-turn-helix domain-containing protein [Yersinia enterocolitica]KAB7666175.1 helix-turn-helix domain-containing protein [Bacillus sp. B1-b2]KLV24165.1 DNA-binding protein [Niallia circulans]MCM3363103.1 helix-turn-helix domain-containing protein [Niallia sp. MER TA 168]
MNIKLEFPEETLIINRTDLKNALQELLMELQEENGHDQILTIKEAADYLKVSVPTIRNMISSKEIPFFQRGQIIRLNRWDVQKWLRNNSG